MWCDLGQPDGRDKIIWEQAWHRELFLQPSSRDIAAALNVIAQRSKSNRERESANGWRFDFKDSVLRWMDVRDAHLAGAIFMGADLQGTNFESANLTGANFYGTKLNHAKFISANLQNANLTNANLEEADLTAVDLRHAILAYAKLTRARLNRALLANATLLSVDMNEAQLMWADLSNSRLAPNNFDKANFQCSKIDGVDAEMFGREPAVQQQLRALLTEQPSRMARDMGAYYRLKW